MLQVSHSPLCDISEAAALAIDSEDTLFALLAEHPNIGPAELAAHANCSTAAIERWFALPATQSELRRIRALTRACADAQVIARTDHRIHTHERIISLLASETFHTAQSTAHAAMIEAARTSANALTRLRHELDPEHTATPSRARPQTGGRSTSVAYAQHSFRFSHSGPVSHAGPVAAPSDVLDAPRSTTPSELRALLADLRSLNREGVPAPTVLSAEVSEAPTRSDVAAPASRPKRPIASRRPVRSQPIAHTPHLSPTIRNRACHRVPNHRRAKVLTSQRISPLTTPDPNHPS